MPGTARRGRRRMASPSNSAEVEQDREALDQPVGYRLHAAGDEHDAGNDQQRTRDLFDHAEVLLEASEEPHEGADAGRRQHPARSASGDSCECCVVF